MDVRSLMLGLCVVLGACSAPGVPMPHPGDPRPVITGAGWMGMECSDRCDVDLTLDGGRVSLTWQDSYGRPVRHAQGRLTAQGMSRLSAIEQALAGEHPPTSPQLGCIDCPEEYLTVQREGHEITYLYDYYSRPPPLTHADRFMDNLIDSMVSCRDNPNVRVTGGRCS